jgi:hypothetical protein
METMEIKQRLFQLKQIEAMAKAERYKLEDELTKIYTVPSDKMSKSFKGDGFKITLNKNEVYKLDQEFYSSIRNEIDESLRPEKVKYDLDIKKYHQLEEKNIDLFKLVQKIVEYKENKSTISIDKIKTGE